MKRRRRFDILFIDSSHVGKIGSDVTDVLFRILPTLRPGVAVHIHDVPWPFEYPRHWIDAGRAWNEAYFVRAFLQYNRDFRVLFFNAYMARHHSELLRENLPRSLDVPSTDITLSNSSLWIIRVPQ